MKSFTSFMQNQLRHQEINLILFLLGLALFKFPLQHYITLSRFEHYGLCLYIWSLGFFLQAVWSWRTLTGIGRASLLSTGIYLGLFAMIFHQSPWLDSRMAVQTDDQEILRFAYAAGGAFTGGIVLILWLVWLFERRNTPAQTALPPATATEKEQGI